MIYQCKSCGQEFDNEEDCNFCCGFEPIICNYPECSCTCACLGLLEDSKGG